MTKVAKKENAVSTIAIPDDYDVGISREDVKMPAILLWQKMSEMVEFEDASVKAGQFVCPVSGDVLGTSFEGAVIKSFATAKMLGEPDDSGRRTVERFSSDCISWNDGARIMPNEFAWQGGEPPKALKSFHYLVIAKELFEKGFELPAIVTFKGTSAKHAKTLNANLLYAKPAWRSWTKFFSAVEEKNGNRYHIMQSKNQPKRLVSDDVAQMCFDTYVSLKNQTLTSSEMEATPVDKEKDFDGAKVDFAG